MRVIAENVVFGYRRGGRVLNGLDWGVESGTTGLLGPNGAGKTTLLSLLVTLARPRSGRIALGEHELTTREGRAAGRRLLGFLPQRFSLPGELTVSDTVAHAAWTSGLPRRECAEAASRALALVDLTDLADRRARTLSGGQRQRVGIACALAHDPRLLVLDEPTAGLDPGQRLRVREVVARLGDDRTVIVSTHLIEDLAHLCSRIGVLADGRIAFDGTFPELEGLIGDTAGNSPYGSGFERAYAGLIERVRGRG